MLQNKKVWVIANIFCMVSCTSTRFTSYMKFEIPDGDVNFSNTLPIRTSYNQINSLKEKSNIIEDANYDKSKSKYFKQNLSDFNSFNYEKYKENSRLYKVSINKEYDIDTTPSVNFFEVGLSKKDLDYIESNFSSVVINNILVQNNDGSVHASNVIRAFLDTDNSFKVSPWEKRKLKDIVVTLNDANDLNSNASYNGIISMSYGYPSSYFEMHRYSPNGIYFDKIYSSKLSSGSQYFSNLLYSKDYVKNVQLRVRSLGNNDYVDFNKYFNNAASKAYSVMSPEVQKMARNDVILAKNIYTESTVDKFDLSIKKTANSYNVLSDNGYSTIKYYELENKDTSIYDAKAMYLRSFTVASEGIIEGATSSAYYTKGSSFSAPRISRLAYDLKVKYPFLSYNQIKQIILTTAKKDSSGYLNDHVGWGVIDRNKALKGPSDFNAGLIEEEKFYIGNLDKIFDNYDIKKNNHDIYFYANIYDGKTYTFSNDITSGLKGDGNTKDYTVYDVVGTDFDYVNRQYMRKSYKYKVPRVLDSERNYYANVKQAGLRKDGPGTLILEGKQYYSTKTQVLNGILELRNDSNSNYEVFKKGTLSIGNPNIFKSNKTINIYNDIINDGTVDFNLSVNLKDYMASNTSKTRINVGRHKIKADNFLVNGEIYYRLKESISLDDLKNIINANNLDLRHAKFKNAFLQDPNFRTDILESVVRDNIWYNPRYTKLANLTKEELRNIPSYDDNAKKFFDSYNFYTDLRYYAIESVGVYNPYRKNADIEKDSAFYHLFNYESESLDLAKRELFTDNYSVIVNAEILQSNKLKNIILDDTTSIKNIDNINIKYTANYITTLLKDPKYTNHNSEIKGNRLSSFFKLSNMAYLNLGAGYYKGKGTLEHNGYNTHMFTGNAGFRLEHKNWYAKYDFIYNYGITSGVRNMQNDKVYYKLNSHNIVNNIGIGYKHNINGIMTINPEINYSNLYYKINNFAESSSENNKPYLSDIKGNIIFKHSIDMKINNKIHIYNFDILVNAKLDININPHTKLKVKTLGVSYDNILPEMYKANVDLQLGARYNMKNLAIESKMNIDTNNNIGIKASYEWQF